MVCDTVNTNLIFCIMPFGLLFITAHYNSKKNAFKKGDRLIHKFDLWTGKYGNYLSKIHLMIP